MVLLLEYRVVVVSNLRKENLKMPILTWGFIPNTCLLREYIDANETRICSVFESAFCGHTGIECVLVVLHYGHRVRDCYQGFGCIPARDDYVSAGVALMQGLYELGDIEPAPF